MLFVSAVSVGEIRRVVERIRHRGDEAQAAMLESRLVEVCGEFRHAILSFDQEAAQVWGRLRVPQPKNPLDKQIAATARIHDLTIVTRNTPHFAATGVRLLNPLR